MGHSDENQMGWWTGTWDSGTTDVDEERGVHNKKGKVETGNHRSWRIMTDTFNI